MQHTVLDKQKIQTTLYVQELFKRFPSLIALDLAIRNSRKKNLLTDQNEYSFTLFLTPFLDAAFYQKQTGVSPDIHISYLENLYPEEEKFYNPGDYIDLNSSSNKEDKEKNKRILDWGDYDDIMSLQSNSERLVVEDTEQNRYNYKQFSHQFLNFHILKNPEFIEEVYYQNQANTSTIEAFYRHRFINSDFQTFSSFLGLPATTLYDKLAFENSMPTYLSPTLTSPGHSDAQLEKFKI